MKNSGCLIAILSASLIAALFTWYIIYIGTDLRIGDTDFYIAYDEASAAYTIMRDLNHDPENPLLIMTVQEDCDEVYWNHDFLLFNTWDKGDTLAYYIIRLNDKTTRSHYSLERYTDSKEYRNAIKEKRIDESSLKRTSFIFKYYRNR